MQSQTASYVLTTLVSAPLTLALTTLANVKDELDLTTIDVSNDTRLTRFIAEESASIARYCNRVFGLATWQDEFRTQQDIRGEGIHAANNPLKLVKWPLATGAVLFAGNSNVGDPNITAIPSTAGLFPGMPVFGTGLQGTQLTPIFASGVQPGAVIQTVSPTSILLSLPMTASNVGTSFTAGISVIEAGHVASHSKQLIAGQDYEIDTGSLAPGDEGASRLFRLNLRGHPKTWKNRNAILVTYQAGYALPNDTSYGANVATLPVDLQSACIRLVVWRFRARGRDPTLRARQQPNLGSEQYWVGAIPGQNGPWPNDIMSVVNAYRQPVVA
jgi:hypothetical protein